MDGRIVAAFYCTLFSSFGMVATFSFGNYIWLAAWIFYFLILYFWVKNGRAPVPLVVIGTVLGCISISKIFFAALIFTLPGVCLMTYIFFHSIISEPDSTPQNCA